MPKITKKQSNQFFELVMKQPWLLEDSRNKAVEEALELCDDEFSQKMIIEMLNRFEFFDDNRMREAFRWIAQQIFNSHSMERTQIVAGTFQKNADSSQFVLHAIKSEMGRLGWGTVRTANNIGNATKLSSAYDQIVIVDEFAGSGRTAVTCAKSVSNNCNNFRVGQGVQGDVQVSLLLVAAPTAAHKHIADHGFSSNSFVELKRGIADYHSGNEYRTYCRKMCKLENKLQEYWDETRLPRFGHGQVQALYGTNNNTPNNVFPIFWWPFLKNEVVRNPLLVRR